MNFIRRAFSLVELMVTLIVISCIMAALVPSITKKLKSQGITVGSGGSGGGGDSSVSTDCSGLFNDDCKLCNINFCLQCDKTCTEGYYKNISRCNCASCTSYNQYCATCDSIGCLSCVEGYKFENGNCILTTVTKEFTSAGDHEFTVPSGVSELTVTLISGGAGGGGGIDTTRNETFVSQGDGDIDVQDEYNILHVKNTGIITWEIPEMLRGKEVTINSCGGGGGRGSAGKGGDGGAIKNAVFTLPDWESIKIHIGGGGGGGDTEATCSLAGWGGGFNNYACNAQQANRYGAGGYLSNVHGGAGYDPIYSNHGSGGGSGGAGYFTRWGVGTDAGSVGTSGSGSLVGGGGGACATRWWSGVSPTQYAVGGGGGAATLFFHEEYANVADIVAPGGGGGGGGSGLVSWGDCGFYHACFGGGGGGVGAGNGGTEDGGNGSGSTNTIFSENYCKGGYDSVSAKPGIMRISYPVKSAASGGGGGQIVPNQKIMVTPGDVLTITVGVGGLGGAIGKPGSSDTSMVSQIANSAGGILISTKVAQNPTGGDTYSESVGTAGKFTNGQGNEVSALDNWVILDGGLANEETGGDGGTTKIDGYTFCSGGVGGNETQGTDALGYGGCGGGGGAPGYAGGAGAPGYVKITWGGS